MSELDQRFSNYIQLKNQIQRLQKEAEVLRKRELTEAISSIKDAIAAYELTAEDLGLTDAISSRRGRKSGKKPAAVGVASGAKRRGRPAKKVATSAGQHGRKAGKKAAGTDKRSVVAPKYRDPSTGATWTGRGKQPKWLAAALKGGKKLEDFKI
jgi:DNA-binding protein H-NS